jgi:DNA modification methylase
MSREQPSAPVNRDYHTPSARAGVRRKGTARPYTERSFRFSGVPSDARSRKTPDAGAAFRRTLKLSVIPLVGMPRMRRVAINGSVRPVLPWTHLWSDHVGGTAWNLYCGDAGRVLGGLSADHYSCVVTSPPYYWQRDYGVRGQLGLESTIAGYVAAIADAMDGVRRVLHPRGVLFLNLGDTYYSGKGRPQGHDSKHPGRRQSRLRAVDASGLGVPKKTLLGMPWRVALEMISRGWILRSTIIWRRIYSPPEPSANDRPWRTHEQLFLFSKSRTYDFNRAPLEAVGEEDVWCIPSHSRTGAHHHPAVFPAELVERCLQVADSKPGQAVLDPFAGSGTVLSVAVGRGLIADGIELSKRYCRRTVADLMALK